jgi:hypothetical protein
MGLISAKDDQFTYFSMQLGDSAWEGKDILDFGGNIGNLLKDPNSSVAEERYWCVDVVKQAIEIGRATYPDAHWTFYDRYNFSYNPTGVANLEIPDLGQKFDYILAYSVFTNTRRSTMIELVPQLESLLKTDGTLAFTFIDPHYHSWPDTFDGNNLHWRLHLVNGAGAIGEIRNMLKKTGTASWFMLVNGKDLYLENEEMGDYDLDDRESCYAYYSTDYMQTIFPKAILLPPVNNEMQHCCVIRNENGR